MGELNLLDSYPRTKRDLTTRQLATDDDRRLANAFGQEYFDGSRNQGYGGFRYDGRWKPVVKRFQEAYGLNSSSRILDVGCAKGFLLHDFREAIPSVTVEGIDVSEYALENAMPDVKPFMHLGNAKKLPYEDKSFDLVIAINTIHNLELDDVRTSLREMQRVSRKNSFLIVDAYRNDEERAALMKWNLTARTILHVQEWENLFRESGYQGDYYWFAP